MASDCAAGGYRNDVAVSGGGQGRKAHVNQVVHIRNPAGLVLFADNKRSRRQPFGQQVERRPAEAEEDVTADGAVEFVGGNRAALENVAEDVGEDHRKEQCR